MFFDLASVSNNTHEPYPFNNALNYIKLAIEIVGDDKLMWGADMPTSLTKSSYDNFINYIMNSDIPLSSKQKYFMIMLINFILSNKGCGKSTAFFNYYIYTDLKLILTFLDGLMKASSHFDYLMHIVHKSQDQLLYF